MITRPEILAPVGDSERLQAALQYGADAVYLAATRFGMRSAPQNFDIDALADAVRRCHEHKVRVYVTCNVLPRNRDLEALPEFLAEMDHIGVDALIVSDLGVMSLMKRYAPHCELHVSTQFGVVNRETARMLGEMGASRVVLARELSMDEIAEIRAAVPSSLELEAFVHGAMCMSYSGRCMLSGYLTGRDANAGDCTQPCRWRYDFVEPNRPDKIFSVAEDGEGTYLFNANDLCMIEHIPELCRAGVSSFKIEGRAKAAYYVACVTQAYKMALDSYMASDGADSFETPGWLREEVLKVSHRPYGTGFYFGEPSQNTVTGGYIRGYQVAAMVTGWENGILTVSQRNRFFAGDTLDVLEPGKESFTFTASSLTDETGAAILSAPHATMTVHMTCDRPITPGSFLRTKV